jgi:teichuronic acid biosynthesis glycosyltransferase TuaC
MQTMNILTYTSLFPNASWRQLGVFISQRVAHVARRTGNTVRVVSPVPYFPRWLPLRRWLKYAQVPRHDWICEMETSYPRYPLLPAIAMRVQGDCMYHGSRKEVARLHARHPFECVDAHFVYPDGYAAVRLGQQLGIPVVVSARGSDINLYPQNVHIRSKIVWTLRNAAGIIAVSKSLEKRIVELGLPQGAVRVIPNGIDPDRFFATERTVARRKLSLPEEAKIIVTVGNLSPQKSHARLIAAFARVGARENKLRLYIVGEGQLRPRLEEQIRALHISDRVILSGSRPNEELQLWFSAADISCLASSAEGWPNVVFESIACGTPVVATNAGGVPEILSKPELGIIVDQTVNSLANGIVRALERNWDREALTRHARERTWDDVAAEVESYLEECVSRWKESKSAQR